MPDQFKKMTKNNGLKNVVWGSEEFVNKIKAIQERESKRKLAWENGMAILEEVLPREQINL